MGFKLIRHSMVVDFALLRSGFHLFTYAELRQN